MFHFCPAGIAHITGIPKIVLASALGMTLAHYEFTGLPMTLSNTPGSLYFYFIKSGSYVHCLINVFSAFLTDHSSHMTFSQRIFNVFMYYVQKCLYLRLYYSEQFLFSCRYNNFPDLIELFKTKMDYILLNVNEFTDPVRPLPPNIKYIGGASILKPRSLPQVWLITRIILFFTGFGEYC